MGIAHGDSIVFDEALYLLNNTEPHTGSNAVELRNAFNYTTNTVITRDWIASVDTITYGFPQVFMPAMERPAQLSFYGKYLPAGADSAYAEVLVFDEAVNQIGAGALSIGGTVPAYTLFDVPVNYTAQDSAAFVSVRFSTASPGCVASFGTHLIIDDVSMSYTATAVQDIAHASENAPYPNPATDVIMLNGVDASHATLRLFDVRGRRVDISTSNTAGTTSIALGAVPPGIYMLQVQDKAGTAVHRVVVR